MGPSADFLADEETVQNLDDHPMTQLLEEFDESYVNQPQTGDIRHGVVVDKRAGELLVDIGYKSEGIVAGREVDRLEDEFKIGQVRGFVPASQLSSESQAMQITEGEPDNRWMQLLDTELRMKVIDLDRRRNRLILSERVAIREWRREQKEKLLESLEENTVCEGVVSSLADFGAFVNLGGADGLVHLSELSWGRISHPSEVVKIGEKIKVMVLNVDRERKRIGLSLRRMLPEPWETVPDRYEVGQVVRGIVTKLVHFGAFARLEDDTIEGLIHISELTERRINHPSEVVAEKQELELRIIRIDTQKRRMGLSLKQVAPEEESVEFDWEPAPLEENEANGDESRAATAETEAAPAEAAAEAAQGRVESEIETESESAPGQNSEDPEYVEAVI